LLRGKRTPQRQQIGAQAGASFVAHQTSNKQPSARMGSPCKPDANHLASGKVKAMHALHKGWAST
jgi:hypothetical protein